MTGAELVRAITALSGWESREVWLAATPVDPIAVAGSVEIDVAGSIVIETR